MSWSLRKEKEGICCTRLFCPKEIFLRFVFYLKMSSVLNTFSEYKDFYKSKITASYTFLLAFKIVESLQCILKGYFDFPELSTV